MGALQTMTDEMRDKVYYRGTDCIKNKSLTKTPNATQQHAYISID